MDVDMMIAATAPISAVALVARAALRPETLRELFRIFLVLNDPWRQPSRGHPGGLGPDAPVTGNNCSAQERRGVAWARVEHPRRVDDHSCRLEVYLGRRPRLPEGGCDCRRAMSRGLRVTSRPTHAW